MTLINDFYGHIQTVNILIVVLSIMVGIFATGWLVWALNESRGAQVASAWVVLIASMVAIPFGARLYYDAVEGVRNTLKDAGYTLIEGFPEGPGSSFVAEKDGEILYCLVGYTFSGDNSVRIECKG